MIATIFGGFLILVGCIFTALGMNDIMDKRGYVKKYVVYDVFKDWDMPKQIFTSGGVTITDENGNAHFYATKYVDERIEKLNKVLKGQK